jgi:transaldolase
MNENPLRKLESYRQSIWLDFISRGAIDSGQLNRWIQEDGVSGITSNPSIFEKAIAETHEYDSAIRATAGGQKPVEDLFQALAIEDIQRAADLLRPIYDQTGAGDGYVSIEVSPGLAHDTQGSISEARNLWKSVNRPNVMIKIPGTREGLPAIRQMLGEGVNVNITLLFGLPRYREVTEAFLGGLEDLAASGRKPLNQAASVASFFLSRIDVLIDPMLDKIIQGGGPNAEIAKSIQGQVAIASAKVAYQMYQEIFQSARFKKLDAQGAHTQRLLWASTSTKNPNYSDVKYVDALIGPDTINTVPVETLDAYRDHGHPMLTLNSDVDQAYRVLDQLATLGINLDAITQQLEDEGVDKFKKSFDQLMESLKKSRSAVMER